MKTFCLTLLLLATCAAAEAQTHFDPRAHTPLDQVVMLCATEPDSARFDSAWLAWLAENPDADVEGAVRTVVSRSGTLRSMAIPGMQVKPRPTRPDPEAIAERMLSLAKRSRSR
jgi:hypothetical protein